MADYIIKRTHIIGHERFLNAGPHARDLYDWGMLYAGQLETDGRIPEIAVLSSPYGHGFKANRKAAERLVEVGLWEKTETGYRILRWTEQGNKTKAQLEDRRREERERKAQYRKKRPSGCPNGTDGGTPHGVLNSPSPLSPESGSRSREGVQGEAAPGWFATDVVATVEQAGLRVDAVPARWLEYRASRERKQWPMNHRDAVGWLTSVLRSEATRKPPAKSTRQPLGDPDAAWLHPKDFDFAEGT